MYRYEVQYAHADTRETNGELTEDTPKGWGTMQIIVDHKIETQADVDEVTRTIAHSNVRDDGTLRYTQVALLKDSYKLLEWNESHLDTDPSTALFPSDFTTGQLAGALLADDEFFAVWGHGDTDEEVALKLIELLKENDVIAPDLSEEDIFSAVIAAGPQRVRARMVGERRSSDELAVSWTSIDDSTHSYPVTVVHLK